MGRTNVKIVILNIAVCTQFPRIFFFNWSICYLFPHMNWFSNPTQPNIINLLLSLKDLSSYSFLLFPTHWLPHKTGILWGLKGKNKINPPPPHTHTHIQVRKIKDGKPTAQQRHLEQDSLNRQFKGNVCIITNLSIIYWQLYFPYLRKNLSIERENKSVGPRKRGSEHLK